MSIEIRIAQWYDFDAVSRLRRAHWMHDLARDESLSPADIGLCAFHQIMQVGGWLGNPKAAIILAFDGTEAVGYLVIGMDHTCPYRQEPTAFVDGFYVMPEYRARHVGGLLYRYAYKNYLPTIPKFTQALVLTHNEDVQKMLVRFGFVEKGRLYEKVN